MKKLRMESYTWQVQTAHLLNPKGGMYGCHLINGRHILTNISALTTFEFLTAIFFKFKISNSMTRHGFGQAKITETSRGRNETKTIIRTINKEIIWRADGLPWSLRVNSIVSPELAALVRGRRRHGAGRAALWLRDDWVLKVDLKISIYVWSYRNRGEIIFSVIRPFAFKVSYE